MSGKIFKFIKKLVALATAFCGGASLVFLITGTGEPLIRILVFVIFFVSLINLGVYAKEFLADKAKKPAPGGQGKSGGAPGGGGQNGNQGGGQGQGNGNGGREGGGRSGNGQRQ